MALVFNGEIYNFRELRAELEAGGIEFRGQSDTEVLLQLYLARRSEGLAVMLRRLNGIIALAQCEADRGELLFGPDALWV